MDESPFYEGLKIEDKHFLPNSVLLTLVLQVLPSAKKNQIHRGEVTFQDVFFGEPIALDRNTSITLSVTNLLGTGKFEVATDDRVVVGGTVVTGSDPSDGHRAITRYLRPVRDPLVALDHSDLYRHLLSSGYEYLPPLRNLTAMSGDAKGDWDVAIESNGDLAAFIESLIQCQFVASDSADPDRLLRLKSIGSLSLCIDSVPPPSGQELRLTFNAKTGVVSGTGVSGRAFIFGHSSLDRTPPQIPDTRLDFLRDDALPLSPRFLDYFADDVESGQIAYSATDRSGSKIMGIAFADEAGILARPDPILSWPVPETWTLEEAAAVPIPFSLAYYMLKILVDVKSYESVLVTNGLGKLGSASIAVALNYTDAVFATVSSEDEKAQLRNRFHQLSGKIIVVPERCEHRLSMDILKMTQLNGINHVVNTCLGQDLEPYLRCMGAFSNLFHVFLTRPEDGSRVTGTENLVRHGSIHGVTLWNVISSCESDKAKIKQLITMGMHSGVVAPPAKLVKAQLSHKDPASNESFTSRDKKSAPSDTIGNTTRFVCKPDYSYLIVSRDVCDGLQAAEWFVKRRAKKIAILHSVAESTGGLAAAKIRAIQQSASLLLQSVDSLDDQTLESCTRHLKDIDAAVVIALDERRQGDPPFSAALVRFLARKCLGAESRLVSVSGSAWKGVEDCLERSRNGMPTKVLLWDGLLPSKSRHYIRLLDSLLASSDHGTCIVKVRDDGEEPGRADKDLDDLLATLPSGSRDVAAYGETVTDEASVIEIRTLSPPYQHVKETIPIFLLPGIKRPGVLLDKFRRSLYPTFLVQLPHLGNSTVEELAAYAVPKMKSVTSSGPFIIVGEQWGGCIALDLARQLDNLGYKSHVFLLSGTPTEVVEPLKFVAAEDETLHVSLLSRLLRIADDEILRDLSNQKNWKNKMNYCSRLVKEELRENVVKGLDAIRCRLRAAVDFSLRSPIAGPLTVVTKKDISSQHYKQLCTSRVSVYVIGDDEDALSDDVFRMIHETALHKTLAR